MNRIANVLLEVDDWPGLATELDITAGEQNAIRGNCKEGSSSDVAKCYRRRLVQTYCYSTGLEVEELVENIVSALLFHWSGGGRVGGEHSQCSGEHRKQATS